MELKEKVREKYGEAALRVKPVEAAAVAPPRVSSVASIPSHRTFMTQARRARSRKRLCSHRSAAAIQRRWPASALAKRSSISAQAVASTCCFPHGALDRPAKRTGSI